MYEGGDLNKCVSELSTMSDTRRDQAFRNFSYHDEDAITIDESCPIQLKPTTAIILLGYVPSHAKSFAINLRAAGNIAFHLNPRLDRGYVVRNSKIKGCWEEEETCSPAASTGHVFKRQSYFHILIFCGPKEFQISVNGEHFCTFTYRLPLELITHFDYDGDVEDIRARITNCEVYPDSKIIKNFKNYQLTDQAPLLNNLTVPINIELVENFKQGGTIFIRGRLKLLPHSFTINLQRGPLIYPHPEIALHLNPRFLFGNRPSCVVMNCWTSGSWCREERHEGHLSWGPGRDFLLTIRCDYDTYVIWLDNKMIGEFRHRLEPSIVDTINITGDIVLHQVSLAFND
ncbi:hypothetical protein HCN44_009571 [Aphidius gifuensis]|uniref:Galectin n=2 Tax=Aphidius gifuensis TaxID=684658 RepID=A0A834Y2M0_APHGI|nr:hypothetical protein HCN44_009571 [Aphidius gifuensis]